jgi:hypothetical protein
MSQSLLQHNVKLFVSKLAAISYYGLISWTSKIGSTKAEDFKKFLVDRVSKIGYGEELMFICDSARSQQCMLFQDLLEELKGFILYLPPLSS